MSPKEASPTRWLGDQAAEAEADDLPIGKALRLLRVGVGISQTKWRGAAARIFGQSRIGKPAARCRACDSWSAIWMRYSWTFTTFRPRSTTSQSVLTG